MIWEEGEYIKPEDYDLSTLEFVFEKNPPKNKIDFLVSDLGCLLVSKRLKDSLIEAKIDNICFYPASIIIEDEREYYSKFYVINISKLESCIDV